MKMFSREPIPNTCPDIDEVISMLEGLRESNKKLRDWGNEEADRVEELESENAELKDDLRKAKDEIYDLNKIVSDLLTN